MIITGTINRLVVDRKTDIGYMLTQDDESVFLHFNESQKRELQSGDIVDAFIYIDGKGRQAATLKIPKLTIKEPAKLTVKEVLPNLGVFIDMGISKDVLLSIDDLPSDRRYWPVTGDQLWVSLKVKGKMVAKLVTHHDIDHDEQLPLKTVVAATVQKIGLEGINLLTDQGTWIFIHQTMYQGTYRLGQRVEAKITYHSERGYSGSLLPQKEHVIDEDANLILKVLKKTGEIPLDSNATPEAIKQRFGLSKKAFKRAIGRLYKQRLVEFVDGKTIYKGD